VCYRAHSQPVSENLLEQDFYASGPNQKWAGDITYCVPGVQGEYDSQWAAICSIAPKIGCTPETLRVWVRQHERDTGSGDGG
ncbi:hypothetical protein MMO01_29660, partial [Escherichia coli]|nr:hypothetical protein [Escherichia coli]